MKRQRCSTASSTIPIWGYGWLATRFGSRTANSDEAFHEKYHEAVVAEFGEDARPTEPEGFDE